MEYVEMSFFAFVFVLFWLSLIGVTCVAFAMGGQPERYGAIIIVSGSVATAILGANHSNQSPQFEIWLLFADSIALLAIGLLALFSTRYWPLWAASFHAIAVMTHFADLMIPNIVPKAYFVFQGFWVYPMFVALLLGCFGHWQTRRSIY
jgi:hypothetical protein